MITNIQQAKWFFAHITKIIPEKNIIFGSLLLYKWPKISNLFRCKDLLLSCLIVNPGDVAKSVYEQKPFFRDIN